MKHGRTCERRHRCRPVPVFRSERAKKRPALVLATSDGEDVILCQITSRLVSDRSVILIGDDDFSTGSLRQESNVRPARIFTADKKIIQYVAGHLKDDVMERIINRLIEIVRALREHRISRHGGCKSHRSDNFFK